MESSTFRDLHWLLDIIQSTNIGILVLDQHFTIEIYNRFMQVHSDINAEDVIGENIFSVFPYLKDDWFIRRVKSVFELGVPIYATFNQRDNVFDFKLKLPIHYQNSKMYQNTTFVPLRTSADKVEKIAIIVYDETDMAMTQMELERSKQAHILLSRTDRLTGLMNRGYWEERLNDEFKRFQRSQEPMSLVIFDIDHFKKVNDSYGHAVGDEAIRFTATTLLSMSRDVDICGRYGGEEFTVILPNTQLSGAQVFCERLREKIAVNTLKSHGCELAFTVSLGICELSSDIVSAQAWLIAADGALYDAKQTGRNKTCIAK